MRRIQSWLSCALLFATVFASACRGQERSARAAAGDIDPALLALVDSMVPRLEVLAGLARLRPIAVAEQDRADLRTYVETRLNQELPPRELAGLRQLYSALGLIPDTLNIRALLLDLYQEQVAGYYDPVSDKFYVIKGTPVGLLRPVLAHELVHALQDQHANLDSLISRVRGNDRQSAAQAAIEGQATVVMFAFLSQEMSGRPVDPATLPDIGAQLRPALEAQNSQFPVFKRAPRIIRETMVFPYVGGAEFVQQLWRARRADAFPAPFGSLLPQSTEQVLHAEDHFINGRDVPVEVRFSAVGNVQYENTLGELETGIFLSTYLGSDARSAAAGWDGDRYQLLKADGGSVLLWQSVWDDAAAADRFAENCRHIAAQRAQRTMRVERNKVQGREGVLVIDAPRGVDIAGIKTPSVRLLGTAP